MYARSSAIYNIVHRLQTPLYYYECASPCSIFIARRAKSIFADDSLVTRVIIHYAILGTAGLNPRLWISLAHSGCSNCSGFNRRDAVKTFVHNSKVLGQRCPNVSLLADLTEEKIRV